MGALATGIQEIFATAKTTGTNVMMCANDGTPDGHISMANLASVINAPTDLSSGDLNNLTETRTYQVFGNLSNYQNFPTGPTVPRGILVVYNNSRSSYVVQLYYEAYNPKSVTYIRTRDNNNVWQSWHEMAMDIPAFYKSYQTLAALSTELCASGVSTDNVSNITTGFTIINSGATGAPTASGYFYAFCFGSGSKKAILALQTSVNEGDAYFGLLNSGTVTWKKVSLT